MGDSIKNVYNFFEKPVDPLTFSAVKIGQIGRAHV